MAPLKKGSYKVVPGRYYRSPKEVWGFRLGPDKRKAREIAWDFLQSNARIFRLEKSMDTLRFHRVKKSLGGHHVIFQQRCGNLRIHRAYVTVHLDNQGRVYLAKNRAMPKKKMPKDVSFPVKESDARRTALKNVRKKGRRIISDPGKEKLPRMERLLFPRKDKLYPAYRFRLYLKNRREEWIVSVNAQSGKSLQRYDNLAKVNARGRVFDPNPVVELGDHKLLLTEKRKKVKVPPTDAYRVVTLTGLKNTGKLDGRYVTTDLTKWPANRANREFCYKSGERGFAEVMAYYHIDTAVRYLEALGFKGACRILGGSVAVDAFGTPKDNSWYSPGLRLLTFGCGGVNDAEDAEVILHEFGHALQDAICPDFGQSKQAAAMGEGFGDYLAASFFAHKKGAEYRASVMTWDAIASHQYTPPCLRRVNGRLTFNDFHPHGDEHNNGKIWSATLWDIREALGREKADTLIVESHFQLDGFTTFDRGARAILDADQNLYRGRYRSRLLRVFRRRRIKPVA